MSPQMISTVMAASSAVQIRAALRLRVVRKLFFVDCDKVTVVDRHAALNDCVVNGSAHADSAEHAFGVKARADELKPARVDHEEVAALADLERADVVAAAKDGRAAACCHLEHVVTAGGSFAAVQTVQQERDAQFLHQR